MRFFLGPFVVLIFGITAYAQQTVPSRISEVTLFTNQALVKRVAAVQVKEGLNEILLELQAYSVDKDSITAEVRGEGEIYSVQYKEIYLKESPRARIRELEQRIRKLGETKRVLQDERDVWGKKESFLQSVIDFSKTQVPKELKTGMLGVGELEKTLGFLDLHYKEINERKQAIDFRLEDIRREMEALQKELDALRRARQAVKKVIEVLFNSPKEQSVRIEAAYLAGGAYWRPLYKVDVPLNLGGLDLVMFSQIKQKTGEDWKDVSLSVSNVIPLKGVGLPRPTSWYLDLIRPRRAGVMKEALTNAGRAPAYAEKKAAAAPDEEAMAQAEFAQAMRRELPLSFEYRFPRPLDIESREKGTLLPLFSKTIEGEYSHYSVPRISPLTFLVCKAKADKELLGGPLNVYFGGRYIGKTILGEKRAGEAFQMSLGADREVKTKREKILDKKKETFFGKIERGKVVRELAYKITVENNKSRAIRMRLFESIPVSRTDRIEVKDVRIEPKPTVANYQDREGVMMWGFGLDPGMQKEIHIRFEVAYPKGAQPPGL